MSDTLALKKSGDRGESSPCAFQSAGILSVLVKPNAQGVAFDPIHAYDGVNLPLDLDAASLEFKPNKILTL